MPRNRSLWGVAALAVIVLLLPQNAAGQTGAIVASEIRVTREEATLSLELVDNTNLAITFRDGRVLSAGSGLGTFTAGGDLERAWRGLLAQALSAEPSALDALLVGWTPPQSLAPGELATARALTELLAQRLDVRPAPQTQSPRLSGQEPLVEFLLANPEATARIQRLVERSPGEVEWWVGGDRAVPEGTRLDGNLAVLEGNLALDGTLGGDLYMFQGDIRLGPNARIEGDLRIDGGLIRGSTQGVSGRVQRMPSGAVSTDDVERDSESSIASDFRRGFEVGWEAGSDLKRTTSRDRGTWWPFFSGLGNLLRTGVSFVILLGLGLGALYFFPRPFEVVMRTGQDSFWRSLLVGWAALILSPFVWITGLLLLLVTIIGIPFAILWIPLFWMALAIALVFGTLAVIRLMGRWWIGQARLPIPRGLDPDKPAVQVGLGAGLLLALAAASAIFQMGGSLFQIFHVLTAVLGGILVANVMALGLGAFLLSRAGREGRWTDDLEPSSGDTNDELFAADPPVAND